MTLTCEEVQERILNWRALGPGERQQVEQHLATCARCQAFFEEEQELRHLFRRWAGSLQVGRARRWRRIRRMALAGALAVILLLWAGFFRSHRAPGLQGIVVSGPLLTAPPTEGDQGVEILGAPAFPVLEPQEVSAFPEVQVVPNPLGGKP